MTLFRPHLCTAALLFFAVLAQSNSLALAQSQDPAPREKSQPKGAPKSPEPPAVDSRSVSNSTGTASASVLSGGSSQQVTTISSKKGAFLDSKASMATFSGEVTVIDPRFSLTCDKLTAFFVRQSGDQKGDLGRSSGLDKAEAEGDVVIIQDKFGEKGELERSLARAQKAVYDSQTGNITLSGWPQVEQKQNITMAAEEGTVIVLNRKGKLEVLGHSKSILRNASMNDGH